MSRRRKTRHASTGAAGRGLAARRPILVDVVVTAIAVLAVLIPSGARALDPERSIAQYRHTAWRVSDGSAPSDFKAVEQTPDGYLWLGGNQGLFRFDGTRFEAVRVPNADRELSTAVNTMMRLRDGGLIVAFSKGGLVRLKNGRFTRLSSPHVRRAVIALAEGRDGAIWAGIGSPDMRLGRFHNGRWDVIDKSWNGPDGFVTSLAVDARNDLWVAIDHELHRLRDGSRRFERIPVEMGIGAGLLADHRGLWISDTLGVRRLDPVRLKIDERSRQLVGQKTRKTVLALDRDDNLWGAAFGGGVFRARPALARHAEQRADSAREEEFTVANGLSGDVAKDLLEDREGNLWLATNGGLDRFTSTSIAIQQVTERDPAFEFGFFKASDGAVYVIDSKRIYRARPRESLKPWMSGFGRPDYMCEGPGGVLWIGADHQMHRVEGSDRRVVRFPLKVDLDAVCRVDGQGVLWVGTYSQGVFRYAAGRWTNFNPIPGFLYANAAKAPDGSVVFFGGRRNLVRALGDRFESIPIPEHLRAGSIWAFSASGQDVLLGADSGLLSLGKATPKLLDADRYRWLNSVIGIAASGRETWILSSAGLVRLRTDNLLAVLAGRDGQLSARIFDQNDGLIGLPETKAGEKLVVGGDGRLWFGTPAAVGMVDPAKLPKNTVPPPILIRSVTVDGKTIDRPTELVLPKGARSLQVDYVALSLTAPERVKFLYKLEGVDDDWVNPGSRRQAFYTNLAPGRYVFRVKAANNDGVWNTDGARLAFRLPPTFVQSRLFVALCIVAVMGLGWLAYSLRLRHVADRIRLRLQERLAERERIARELHDTLLQGVQGLVLSFQSVSDDVPPGTPAKLELERTLDRAEGIIVEARERVRSLRATSAGDLADTLAEVAARIDPEGRVETRIMAEGAQRPLHPVVADEVERIVTEALFNAYSHAKARLVVVEIVYDPKQLGVRVRDDGVGIEQAILDAGGREGHYGLTGMRERAAKIDGQLIVRSRPGAGAEVELTIPAGAAYRARGRNWTLPWGKASALEATP